MAQPSRNNLYSFPWGVGEPRGCLMSTARGAGVRGGRRRPERPQMHEQLGVQKVQPFERWRW